VLDLGAGTGKLARLLAASGARVVAVEPVAAMRALIPEAVEVVAGSAETIPLRDASVDAVTIAQAFQWFRPQQALAEIRRVLRPGGRLALVANLRDESDPLQRAFAKVLARHRGHPTLEPELGAIEPVEIATFHHVHELAAEELAVLAASETSIAFLEDGAREAALAEFAALGRPGTRVRLRYVTEVRLTPQATAPAC
jgi:ubiquinone/menaquinone biosynthesis C-methylase UbiE